MMVIFNNKTTINQIRHPQTLPNKKTKLHHKTTKIKQIEENTNKKHTQKQQHRNQSQAVGMQGEHLYHWGQTVRLLKS